MKCPKCGKEFYVKDARHAFNEYFNDQIKYDKAFEKRICSDCAIAAIESGMNKATEDAEQFESYKEEYEEKSSEEKTNHMLKILDEVYDLAITGVPFVSKSVEELAYDYSTKTYGKTKEFDLAKAAKALIRNQIIKCGTSGFITGLGGLITLPVAVPANISSVLYVQIRMVASLACLGGYDVHSDQVQSLVYACLAGKATADILKPTGIKIGEKLAVNAIDKIPGKVLIAINKKVGFRLFTKFGEKGAINLGKMVPAVGGFIGGAFDATTTKAVGSAAYRLFIKGQI